MTDALLIGTYGWEHAQWDGRFYEEGLPPEWRFCYFSNEVRAVIVPGDVWARVDVATVNGWMDDCDEAFRFVVELPAGLARPAASAAQRAAFDRLIAPLQPRLAGAFVRPTGPPPPDACWLQGLVRSLPMAVCVDLCGAWDTAVLRDAVAAGEAGRCWRPADSPAPAPGGKFLVALVDSGDLQALRGAIEALGCWMGARRGAGLFFTRPERAPGLAEQARTIAELMNI